MHIIKFDRQFARRHIMASAGKSFIGAGMLGPLWHVIARDGDVQKAYPEEAMSIEHYSNGAVKSGGVIDASNVDSVKELIDPVLYMEIAQQGRVLDVKKPETDIMRLSPRAYVEATLRNRGKASLDTIGNVVTGDGKPWIGGHPFPDGESAFKVVIGHALNWARHDVSFFTLNEWDLDAEDNVEFHYQFLFLEYMAVARTVLDPKPYMPSYGDKLRYSTFLLTAPQAVKGTSVLNIWYYDQSKLPEFFGFLPDFKRIRRFTSSQRFEPSLPGSNFNPTDTFMMGDPALTWGNFKLVGKVPFLAAVSDRWWGEKDNWFADRVGGKSGQRFFRTTVELIPECYVIDMEPIRYPEAPYGKRRVWYDPRSMNPVTALIFDRKGQLIKNYINNVGNYQTREGLRWPEKGDPFWGWSTSTIHNAKTDSISLVQPVRQIDGGFGPRVNDPRTYEQFCTIPAVRRLGK